MRATSQSLIYARARSARRHLPRLSAARRPRDADTRRIVYPGLRDAPRNPLGIKGAGESAITGVSAAIASVTDDAICISGTVMRLPLTPQRLKQLPTKRQSARSRNAGECPLCPITDVERATLDVR